MSSMAKDMGTDERVLLFVDNSITNNGKDSVILTDKFIYSKYNKPIQLEEIKVFEMCKRLGAPYIKINNNTEVYFTSNNDEKFFKFMKSILPQFSIKIDEKAEELEEQAFGNDIFLKSKENIIKQGQQDDEQLSVINDKVENNEVVTSNTESDNIIDKLIQICQKYNTSNYHVANNIPSKKIRNAIASYRIPASTEIVALVDGTIFQSAKNGLAICSDGLYWNSPNFKPKSEKQQLLWPEFKDANITKGDFCIKFYDNILFNVTGSPYDTNIIIDLLKDIQDFIKIYYTKDTSLTKEETVKDNILPQDSKVKNIENFKSIEKCSKCQCLKCTFECRFKSCFSCRSGSFIAYCDKVKANVRKFNTFTLNLANNATGQSSKYKVLGLVGDCTLDKQYILLENLSNSNDKLILYYYPGIKEDSYGEITNINEFNFAIKTYENAQ